jgi:hypothetical protein
MMTDYDLVFCKTGLLVHGILLLVEMRQQRLKLNL